MITEESRGAVLLRALVHAFAAAVFAYPLASENPVICAAIGSFVGVISARYVAATKWRLITIVAALLATLVLVVAAGRVITSSASMAAWLSPAGALMTGDSVSFGLGALVLSALLRAASLRRRAWTAFEIAFIATAFAELVAAHRQGAINRPFEIADPILAAGGDPTVAILAVGAAAVAVIVLLLVNEKSALRTVFHLAVVALLLGIVFGTTRMMGVPPPPPTSDGVGLRGEGSNPDRSPNPSPAPVAVVLLEDDYSPPTGTYYFRQSSMSYWNGRRLINANRNDADRDIARSFPTAPTNVEHPSAGPDRMEVRTTVALIADHTQPFALESLASLRPARNPNPTRFVRTYSVTSMALVSEYLALLGLRAGASSWSPEMLTYYTRGPSDARYRALAEQIVAELPADLREEPIVRALAITKWLGHEGVYSLRARNASTESFLFGEKVGYCVDFAHAAVTLMRSIGLPARVSEGYQAPESSRQGGSAIVLTDGYAHAWPEVYLDGVGWVVTDVAPERSLDPPPEPPDPDLQRLLGEMMRGESPMPPGTENIPPMMARLRHTARFVGVAMLALLLSVLATLYVIKIWRVIAPTFASDQTQARVLYRAMLDRLSAVGHARDVGESRERFASRMRPIAPSFDVVTHAHLAATFGGRFDVAEMRRAARESTRELGRQVPLWKRWLGALAPWSFMRSR